MKVPRIAFGVRLRSDRGIDRVVEINVTAGTFLCKCEAAIGSAENGACFHLPISEYDPAPTFENFLKAVDQWDYYSNMSDSAAVIAEGKEMAKALRAMFKELPKEDQHRIQKIVDIVVNV